MGRINATNPCSEYAFLDDTACNRVAEPAHLLRRPLRRFDIEAYRHAVRIWTLILEISVYMAQFPSGSVRRSRTTSALGLGYANLGALLMVQGIPYDSGGAGRSALNGHHARGGLCAASRRDRRRGRALPALPRQPRGDAPRHPQPPPGGLQPRAGGVRGAHGDAGRHRCPLLPAEPSRRARSESDRMLGLGRAAATATPRSRSSRRPAPLASSWIATRPGSSPTSPLVKFKKLAGAGTSRSSTSRCRRRWPSSATPSGRSTTSSATARGPRRSRVVRT